MAKNTEILLQNIRIMECDHQNIPISTIKHKAGEYWRLIPKHANALNTLHSLYSHSIAKPLNILSNSKAYTQNTEKIQMHRHLNTQIYRYTDT